MMMNLFHTGKNNSDDINDDGSNIIRGIVPIIMIISIRNNTTSIKTKHKTGEY